MMRRFFLLLSVYILSAPLAFAQVSALPGIGNSVLLDISPQYPAPGEIVHIVARSSLIRLNQSSFVWFRDGKRVPVAADTTSIDITAGALGVPTDIVAQVTTADGTNAQAATRITPTSLDLLFEAETFVPPFYRGRALATGGVTLDFHALPWFKKPNGAVVSTKDITFTWRRGDEIISSASGRGLNTARITLAPFSHTSAISVEATSIDGTFSNKTSLSIPVLEPSLLLYEDHPLFGILYNAALPADSSITDTELTVRATPLFAPTHSDRDSALSYHWTVDDLPVASSTKASEITLHPSAGKATVAVDISHAHNIFYETSGSWNILLNQKATNSPIGTLFAPRP